MATEVKQRNNRVLIYVGALLALAAAGALLFLAQRNSGTSTASTPTVKVVYASVSIPKGTKITPDMLVLKDVNPDSVGTAATDFTQVVNKFPAITVAAGSQMQAGFLLADAASANAATLALQPLDIPDGHVAMAIPVAWPGGDAFRSANLFSIAGLIQADDHIDMIVDPKGDGTVRFGFQDVHVLRVGGAAPAPGAAATPSDVLIIEVPRAQAEQIAFVFNGKSTAGVVRYVLRPRSQYSKGYLGIDDHGGSPNLPLPVDQPVTPDQFSKLFPTK